MSIWSACSSQALDDAENLLIEARDFLDGLVIGHLVADQQRHALCRKIVKYLDDLNGSAYNEE